MRVAIDATPLSQPAGGVRRYTEELARALADVFAADEYVLFSDQAFDTCLQLKRSAPPKGKFARRWWLFGVQNEMRRLGSDLFHGTDFSVPYLPLRPAVMTLHDISPWRNELAGAASERVRVRTPILLRLGLATMVITPTEAVRAEAIRRFALAPERVVAVPEAPSFEPPTRPLPRSGRPYFLFVGTIEPRKNVTKLILAWRELQNEANLVLIGHKRDDTEIPAEPGIEYLGPLPDEELPRWYAGAVACVYASAYEGFGLPVLEAMQCGAPVITSRDPAIQEVSGGAAVTVDAGDVSGLAAAMRAMLAPEVAAAWRERGLARAAQFSWRRTARETREVYAEAIRRFHG